MLFSGEKLPDLSSPVIVLFIESSIVSHKRVNLSILSLCRNNSVFTFLYPCTYHRAILAQFTSYNVISELGLLFYTNTGNDMKISWENFLFIDVIGNFN